MNTNLITLCLLLTGINIMNAQDNGNIVTDSVRFANLEEIVVTSRKPLSIVRADRISYLPSEMTSAIGSNVYDALQSIPGLSIGSNGVISVNGESGISVYIDGRKSILTGEMLISHLKSLSTSGIEKIEILTVPGAKRDASEASTIINLQKKRKKDEGFTIGLNSGGHIGKARNVYGNIYTEYLMNSHYLQLTYSGNRARNTSKLFTVRPYSDNDEHLQQNYDRIRHDVMHNIGFSYDYQPNSSFKTGSVVNYNYFKRREPAVMTTFIPDSEPTVTDNTACFINKNIYGGVYLKRIFNHPETDFNLSLDFFNYHNSEDQFMNDNTGNSIIGDMSSKIFGLVGAMDYRRRLSSHWHFSCGTRISYVKMNSHGNYEDLKAAQINSRQNQADNFGSDFGYNENVNALYFESKATYGISALSLGVRMEQSSTHNAFSGNESAESKDYAGHDLRIYPSVALSINAAESGSWVLSYSEKITRPRFADLDPFIHIFDDITHVGGNVNLKEAIGHCVDMAYSNNSWLRIGVRAMYTSDEIVKCYREITDKTVYVTPENLPRYLQFIGTVSAANIKISSWWASSITANIVYSNYHFPASLDSSSNIMFTPMIDVRNRLNLPYGWATELNVSYRSKAAYGQAEVSSSWSAYLGFRKSFFNNSLNLAIYMNDVFNTNRTCSKIVISGREASLQEREFENMRRLGVSFSFRFNSGKNTSGKENRKSCIDEMNRVNL